MKTLNQMMGEFNKAYEIEPIGHTKEELLNVAGLIADEWDELNEEINAKTIDIRGIAAELTDLAYIVMERMTALGFDVDALLAEKHRSNMSKVIPAEIPLIAELKEALKRYPDAEMICVEGGFVLKCMKTSKLIKPMCYSKAIITDEMVGK